ncbi:hypothetical protein [Haloarcula onubensis]|uniref:Flagellin n=1 Tax=Haloarcula onubensis TaxID=2950539 RepID=A0ABU2FJH6_9EURY|nr:hypothetical protein [Halomicroarcula sp. S3CR25-11]MDS0280903.1 hypothetical protein [Halomicroarcula sp. S3CR25-11]
MFEDVDPPEVSMVRVLLVLAIGLPIAIEVVTFGGLVGHYVGGGQGAATPTATPEVDGAAVGDEILPETTATERVTEATVVAREDSWRFVLTVNVTDAADGYELRLDSVTTRDGRTVDGSGATTGALSPGQSGAVTGTWRLPAGQRPDTLRATVVTTPANGTASARGYTVEIGDVPVSGN